MEKHSPNMFSETQWLERTLHGQLCAFFKVMEDPIGRLRLDIPFRFEGGASYWIFLKPHPKGGYWMVDEGRTLKKLRQCHGETLIQKVVADHSVQYELDRSGVQIKGDELTARTHRPYLLDQLFKFIVAIVRLCDFCKAARTLELELEFARKEALHVVD